MRNFCPLVLLAAFALSACSNLSKNAVREGRLIIRGGVAGDKVWRDHLEFKRYTWFHEMTMWLDLNLAEITSTSPFFAWASPEERAAIQGCRRYWIALAYAWDSKKISEKDMLYQLENKGRTQHLARNLIANVGMHPDYDRLGLDRHHAYGLCQKGPDSTVSLDFPGFAPVAVG